MYWRLLQPDAAIGCRQCRNFASRVEKVAFDAAQPHKVEQQLLQQDVPAPKVVTGAMESWPARAWSVQHLQQFGSVTVPVEVSYNGGDYRDLHTANSHRRFEADMQVPLSVILESMQTSSHTQTPAQVSQIGRAHV